ncbi:hypothetical protein RJ55_02895 [Drechmeria coniospora]|nr:hypothetical protein RJ55_02895 [Drechmeria coniospora]
MGALPPAVLAFWRAGTCGPGTFSRRRRCGPSFIKTVCDGHEPLNGRHASSSSSGMGGTRPASALHEHRPSRGGHGTLRHRRLARPSPTSSPARPWAPPSDAGGLPANARARRAVWVASPPCRRHLVAHECYHTYLVSSPRRAECRYMFTDHDGRTQYGVFGAYMHKNMVQIRHRSSSCASMLQVNGVQYGASTYSTEYGVVHAARICCTTWLSLGSTLCSLRTCTNYLLCLAPDASVTTSSAKPSASTRAADLAVRVQVDDENRR